MRLLRSLLRNITVLNLVLVAVIAILASYVLTPMIHLNVKYTRPPTKKTESAKEESPAPSQAPSPLDYTIIADQNLFHPERIIPVDKPATPPLPKPEFVLYGVLITDDTSVAYVEDKKAPQSTAGRGKRQTALRKGENLSGFTLTQIEANKIVMVRGEEIVTVSLNDQPKAREAATAQAQPQAAPPGQPAAPPRPPQPSGTPPPRQVTTAPPGQQPAAVPGEGTATTAKKTFLDFFKSKNN